MSDPLEALDGIEALTTTPLALQHIAVVRAALEKQTEMEAALRFVEQATEEVLELEEPPAEIADVATSAARAIRDTVCAALAAQPVSQPADPEDKRYHAMLDIQANTGIRKPADPPESR